jgi:hypothetical protein
MSTKWNPLERVADDAVAAMGMMRKSAVRTPATEAARRRRRLPLVTKSNATEVCAIPAPSSTLSLAANNLLTPTKGAHFGTRCDLSPYVPCLCRSSHKSSARSDEASEALYEDAEADSGVLGGVDEPDEDSDEGLGV